MPTASEKSRLWRRNNPDKVRAYKKRYHANHIEAVHKRHAQRYQRNKDQIKERLKKWRSENPEQIHRAQREWRAKNRERVRLYQRNHRLRNRGSWFLSSVKKSAQRLGVDFDLDKEWFERRLGAGLCELSGLAFDFSAPVKGGPRIAGGPSVDRINAKKGYTKDNCRLILWWLNRALSNLGDEYALHVFRHVFIRRGEIGGTMAAEAA